VRELAEHRIDRYPTVLHYLAGEALKSYEARLREQARTDYNLRCQIWASLAATGATKSKPPEPPPILKDL
jgi:hypothetical protein